MPWGERTAQAYAELGRQHHLDILLPELPGLLGEMDGRRALDFGCGPGRFSAAMVEAGAALSQVVELPATRDGDGTPCGPPAYLAILAEPRP